MAYRTIESGSCFNEQPHKEHVFRPAIFGLGLKVKCKGISQAMYDLRTGKKTIQQIREEAGYPVIEEPAPVHKHRLLLHMYPKYPFVHPDKVVTHCNGCGVWFSIDKEGFYNILLDRLYSYTISTESDESLR